MESPRPRWRRRPWWPRPFEAITVVASVGTLLFLRGHGLDYGWNTIRYSFPNLLGMVPVLLLQGVALQVAARVVTRASVREFFRALAAGSWWSLWARLWIVSSIQAYTYMWLKVSVPLLRADLYDVELWHLDRWLHFGVSPTVFAIELVAGTPFAKGIDLLYSWWVPSIPLILSFFYTADRDDLRRNLALAGTLLWIGGAWLYFAVPAVGPCYASADVLEPIRDAMPRAMGAQAGLWQNYLMMVRSRGSMLESFSPLYGVAAMPSLHVAAYAMLMFWSRHHARRWFWPFVGGTAVIFFGSLATGWHYAVDGYAGIALGWAAVRIAGRLEPVAPPGEIQTPPRADSSAATPTESDAAPAGAEAT